MGGTRPVADPSALNRDERHMLTATRKGHVVVSETGAIWYKPRTDNIHGYESVDSQRRVDRTVRALEGAQLLRIVAIGPCELTGAGDTVLAGLGGAR